MCPNIVQAFLSDVDDDRKAIAVEGLKGSCECCVAKVDEDKAVFPGSVMWLMCLLVESWQEEPT